MSDAWRVITVVGVVEAVAFVALVLWTVALVLWTERMLWRERKEKEKMKRA